MIHILFLVSGGGGNFKFFHHAIEKKIISNIHLSMISDRMCGAIQYAKNNDVDNYIISYSRSNPSILQQLLCEINPDFIVTNWHKIIDSNTLIKHQGKFINLHYSLLPAFAGLIGIEPIKKAYEQGCEYIGPTCHLVDEGIDTGKILAQSFFTTDRSFNDAVTMMFRTGCLVLLNGLSILMGHYKLDSLSINTTSFLPPLNFDNSLFDEEFWEKVERS